MLEVDGIDVAYGHIKVLTRVSLRVDAGEIVAMIGANGAGKTTTLRAISALVPTLRGDIKLDGERIDELRPEAIVAMGVSHCPEGRGVFPSLTVEENLRMGWYAKRRDRKGWSDASERATEPFPRLRERWHQAAGTLSGGEQQMLVLARALVPTPRLLMVDELSLGLAPIVVRDLFEVLKRINAEGTAILLVEQYVNHALRVANRVYVLEKGAVAHEAEAAELRGNEDLVRRLYVGDAEARKELTRASG